MPVKSSKGAPRRPTHLVTFCNVGRPAFALIDADGIVAAYTIDMTPLGRNAGGTVGVVFDKERCYIAVQCDPPAVAVFAADWTQVALFAPDDVKDIHGLAIHAGELLIVSTASNQILAYDLAATTLRCLWASPDALTDTVHLNDIAATGGRVVAARFGPRTAAGQRDGAVFDVLTGEIIAAHLREPHSVVLADGLVHVLESPTGDMLRCRPGFSPQRVCGIVGYARGLAVGPTSIAIGKSGYRRNSRQGIGDSRLAPLTATAAAADAQALSGVFLIDRATGESRFVDTSSMGEEVYSVVELPATPPPARRTGGRKTRPA